MSSRLSRSSPCGFFDRAFVTALAALATTLAAGGGGSFGSIGNGPSGALGSYEERAAWAAGRADGAWEGGQLDG